MVSPAEYRRGVLLDADIELKSLCRSCECLACAGDAGLVGGRRFCEVALMVQEQ